MNAVLIALLAVSGLASLVTCSHALGDCHPTITRPQKGIATAVACSEQTDNNFVRSALPYAGSYTVQAPGTDTLRPVPQPSAEAVASSFCLWICRRRRSKRRALTLLVLLASVLPVRGAQAVLRDDTYVDFSNPTQSFGALPLMLVDSSSQNNAVSFVRFDLSNLPADTVSSQVARSTLRLWVVRVNSPATVTVEAVGGEWQEGKVTAITRPFIAQGAAVPPPVSVPVANASQWVLIDVTPVVKAWIDRTLPNDGLALTATAGSVSLGTKESSSSGQAVLEIILTGSPIAAADPTRADASIHPTSATVPTGAARSKGTEGPEAPQRTQSALSLPVTGARVIEYAAAKCQAGAAATGFNLPSLNAPAALCDANDGRAVLSFKPGNTVNPESLILAAAPSSITALIRGRGATPGTAVWRLRYVCSSPGQTSSPVLAYSVTASMTVVSSPARAESEAEMAVSPAGCVARGRIHWQISLVSETLPSGDPQLLSVVLAMQ